MNSDPEAPMDNQLLQLERELFSLSPVETPRRLAARLERQVAAPVGLGRPLADSGKVIPFPWRRMVVPAAAAVVVVSVLHHLDAPANRNTGVAQSNPLVPGGGPEILSPGQPAVVATPAGYVLRTEPVLINPGTWQTMDAQYFLVPGTGSAGSYNGVPRSTGLSPVVFH